MRIRLGHLAVLLAIPLTIAGAQRRGGGGGGGGGLGGGRRGRGGYGGAAQPVRFPTASDLNKYNPASLLIDKKKSLTLSEAQVATLNSLRDSITSRNGDLMSHYDSVQRAYKPPTTPSREAPDRESMDQATHLRALIDSLQVRRLLDVSDALAVVTDAKARQQAAELLMKQEQDYHTKLPPPPNARGGFGGGGFGPGGVN